MPDAEAAVASIHERLRPAGVAVAYVWGYAEGMEFLRCFWDAALALKPRAAALDESKRFPRCQPSALASLFRTAGLANVETDALEIPTDFVASLDPHDRESLRRQVEGRLQTQSGLIRLRARAWTARGISP